MKKTLIALAAVAVAGAASAQVTLSGSMNFDIGNTTAADSKYMGLADANFKLSVNEDLGGGLSISGYTTVETAGGRNQSATADGFGLTLAGGFGSLTYKNYLTGASYNDVSASHDVAYFMGDGSGYTVRNRLQYALPTLAEGVSLSLAWDNDGQTSGKRSGGTTLEDVKVFWGYSAIENVSLGGSFYTGSDAWDLSASYNAGVATIGATMTSGDTRSFVVTAPLGAMNFKFVNESNGTQKANAVMASYALSKRTALTVSFVNGSGVDETVPASTYAVTGGAENEVTSTEVPGKAATNGSNYRIRLSHSF